MTHKISTMLLPTGRWLALMSTDELPGPDDAQAIANVFIDSGAAGFMITDTSGFTIDNAFIEEGAKDSFDITGPRAEAWKREERAAATRKAVDEWVDRMTRPADSQHYTDFAAGGRVEPQVDPVTLKTFERVQEGAEVSPAGLIRLTDEQKANAEALSEEVLTGKLNPMAPVEPERLSHGTRVFILADESTYGTDLTTDNYGQIGWDDPSYVGRVLNVDGDYMVTTDSGLSVALRAEDVRPVDGIDPVSVAAGTRELVGGELLESLED